MFIGYRSLVAEIIFIPFSIVLIIELVNITIPSKSSFLDSCPPLVDMLVEAGDNKYAIIGGFIVE